MNVTVWHNCYSKSHKGLVTPASFAHPAKMSVALCERIFKHGEEKGYWKPGTDSLIVDPFAGIFTTGILGAYAGYAVLGIELEEAFVTLARENLNLHAYKWAHLGLPLPQIVQGDSRNLRQIVAQATGCVSSPPFVESRESKDEAFIRKVQSDALSGKTKGHGSTQQYLDRAGTWEGYGSAPGQLGAMKAGDHAQVVGSITSPPYAESLKSETEVQTARKQERIALAKALNDGRRLEAPSAGKAGMGGGYGQSAGQLGAMPTGDLQQVVGAISSPPFEQSIANADSNGVGKGIEAQRARGEGPRAGRTAAEYGDTEGQVGQMQGGTYWEACRDVYAALYDVLIPNGVLCLVVKGYVKQGRLVDLPQQTLALLLALGYEHLETIHASLVKETRATNLFGEEDVKKSARKSFFRQLAEKRGAPPIDWETVLFVRKRGGGDG